MHIAAPAVETHIHRCRCAGIIGLRHNHLVINGVSLNITVRRGFPPGVIIMLRITSGIIIILFCRDFLQNWNSLSHCFIHRYGITGIDNGLLNTVADSGYSIICSPTIGRVVCADCSTCRHGCSSNIIRILNHDKARTGLVVDIAVLPSIMLVIPPG